MLDQVKGFSVTLRHLFRKPVTQRYPEYKRPVYPRFRGRHQLHRHPNGLEKCVACGLCSVACPADAIVFGDLNNPESKVAKMRNNPRGFYSLEEVNARPQITYLSKVRNRAPEGKKHGEQAEHS